MLPVGTVLPYAGEIDEKSKARLKVEGFLFCNGDAYQPRDYSELYDVIQYYYGKCEDGKFRVPDYRGLFLRGADFGSGRDPDSAGRMPQSKEKNISGKNVGSIQKDDIRMHDHRIGNVHYRSFLGSSGSDHPLKDCQGNEYYTGKTGGKETRPINVYVHYIICYSSMMNE